MAKDPATLFYWNDWHTGTMTMSRHLKGCYMDLLCAQFNSGHLSIEQIKIVLGNDFAAWQGSLSKKFATDKDGFFFNVKLEEAIEVRKNYTASRRNNLKSKPPPHMGNHMENGSGNEIGNEDEKTFGKSENLLKMPPSKAMVIQMFTMVGLKEADGDDFFDSVEGKTGWNNIHNWSQYTLSTIKRKLKEQKYQNHNGKKQPDLSYRDIAKS